MAAADAAAGAAAGAETSLQVFLRMMGREAFVPVELPLDATVGSLKRAAEDAGGPPPRRQRLSVGAAVLGEPDATPLSETQIGMEAVVTVWQAPVQNKVMSAGDTHCLAVLEDGHVLGRGPGECYRPFPSMIGTSDSKRIVSVHAANGCSSALLADGTVLLWGKNAVSLEADVQKLAGRRIVSFAMCVASAAEAFFVAADADGHVFVDGPGADAVGEVPRRVQGKAAAVTAAGRHAAVLLKEGTVVCFGSAGAEQLTPPQLGGRAVRAVHTGPTHTALILDDGSVKCFGQNDSAQCDVPKELCDVVMCECGARYTVALDRSGKLHAWGDTPFMQHVRSAGKCRAVTAGWQNFSALKEDGTVWDGWGRTLVWNVPIADPPEH
eukprot:TRINITY_DN3351_c0_g1_i1.p1 TRINITY_DN3351_c0_g1~~TRINITY_DN3351_c0_g1_i1.p1  ORF type:complete len:381 (+),score=135.34 TRINITY_DN3351_c0_g1_i1:69-1211(+)